MMAVRGLTGVLFHTLRHDSVPGWSTVQGASLDVAKIIKVDYFPRKFCLWQRQHPYTLHITYAEPQQRLGVAPTVGSNGGGAAFYNEIEVNSIISRRYKSEQHCQEEIGEIFRKQGLLDTYIQRLRDKITRQ